MRLQDLHDMPRRPPSRRKPPPGQASPRRSRNSRVLSFEPPHGGSDGAGSQQGLLTARSGSSSALRRSADWALRDLGAGDGDGAAGSSLPEPLPVTVPVSTTNGQLPRDSPRRGEEAVAYSRPVRAASAGVAANVALMAALEAKADGPTGGSGAEPSPEALAAAAGGLAAKRLHKTSPGEHLCFRVAVEHGGAHECAPILRAPYARLAC